MLKGSLSPAVGPARLRVFVAHPSPLLTDHRAHGDGLIAWGFIQALAARGHDVHVAVQALDLQGEPGENVHLHLLGSGSTGSLGRVGFMRRMRACFFRLQRRTRFDVIHQLNPVDVGVSLALFDVPTPIILGPYWPDFSPERWQGPGPATTALKRGLRWAQQRRARVVLLSTPAAAPKLERRTAGVLVRELGPGIDAAMWAPPERFEPNHDVLFVAALQPYKGPLVMLDAFERLASELRSARLLIAGTGPEQAAISDRIRASAARERISLLGALSRDDVRRAMQTCAVYCMPSYGEPFGMGALEAMACGRPVVGTDAGGLRYLLSEAGGAKVPPGNVEALAAALRRILADPALQRAMGGHNRRRVEARYTWPQVTERLEAVYREALTDRGQSAR